MKLGLIAMSAVRAHNAELTALGLTLPGFVERSRVIASLPSLGLLTLAGMTPDDVDLEYVEVPDLTGVDGLPGEFDAVAISSFTAQIKEAYALADRYRAHGTTVLLGGLHVTAQPAEALLHADAIVIGEGEPSWPRLIQDLQHRTLSPVYDSRSQPFDLAHSPMPRFELLAHARYTRMTVQTARGCPFNCEFCAASLRLCPTYRIKPIDRVIDEIQSIKRIQPNPFIEFADDNTFVNKRHGKELMRALMKENVRWFTETDVSVADDPELLEMMRDAGCAQVLIGFESVSRHGLTGVELTSDWKARQYDNCKAAIARIQERGITVNGCFVLGMDNQATDVFDGVLRFVRETGLYDVQITILTAFPGTPLYARLTQENRLLEPEAWELCTLFDVNFMPKHMSKHHLETEFRGLVQRLYSQECTARRHRDFYARRAARRRRRDPFRETVS